MICGSTMQAAISKLGFDPCAVKVPLTSISIGALAKVNNMAQALKINKRRSASTLKYFTGLSPSLRCGGRSSSGATAERRSGNKATNAGKVSAAVRKNTARSDTYCPQAPMRAAPTPLPMAA
jgi:hypothetical protein